MNYHRFTAFIFTLLVIAGVLQAAESFTLTPRAGCDEVFLINWSNEPINCSVGTKQCIALGQDGICYLNLSSPSSKKRTGVLAVVFAYDERGVMSVFYHEKITCADVVEHQVKRSVSDDHRRMAPALSWTPIPSFEQMEDFLQGKKTSDRSMTWFNDLVVPIVLENFELRDGERVYFKPLHEGTDKQRCFPLDEKVEVAAATAAEDATDA